MLAEYRNRPGFATRDMLLLAGALLVLAYAGWTMMRPARSPIPPEIADARLAFRCAACDQPFELSGAQVQDALAAQANPRDTATQGARSDGGNGFPCPHCNRREGYRDPDSDPGRG